MLKEEFLKITGLKEISDEDYAKLNLVYEEMPTMSKEEFCEIYSHFGLTDLFKMCEELALSKRRLEADRDNWQRKAESLAGNVVLDFTDMAEDDAYGILGTCKVIKMKLINKNNVELNQRDIDYIKNHLQ